MAAAGGSAQGTAGTVVPVPGGAGEAARADAAQRREGVVSGRRAPGAVRVHGGLVILCWAHQLWLLFALALFAHGTIGTFFRGLATHELNHKTVFRTKWLNKLFLYVYALPSWDNPFHYAVSHTYHHRYTLHPEGDREAVLPANVSLRLLLLLQLFTFNMWRSRRNLGHGGLLPILLDTVEAAFGVVGGEWWTAMYADQPREKRKAIWWARAILAFHGAILAVAVVTGLWVLPIVLSLFPFIANWWAHFVGLPMHAGLRDNVTDFRKCVRSITLDPFSEFIYWHMNWHTEHHMYAGVPCYNLSRLYREIALDMPKPRTLAEAWREMRTIWKRQQPNRTTSTTPRCRPPPTPAPHLPPPAGHSPTTSPNRSADSPPPDSSLLLALLAVADAWTTAQTRVPVPRGEVMEC